MTTVEMMLRGLVDHPRRGLFVIILTCLLALLTVWPLVDEYFVVVSDCERLELQIVDTEQEILSIDELRKLGHAQAARLEQLRQRTIGEQELHGFSSRLVEITRSAGCQLRRVDLGQVQKRKWLEGDDPLRALPASAGAKETPFELCTQRVGLSISGPLERVQALLSELHALDKLAHTQSIQLKPNSDDRSEVNLDLELLFFDLRRASKPPKAT